MSTYTSNQNQIRRSRSSAVSTSPAVLARTSAPQMIDLRSDLHQRVLSPVETRELQSSSTCYELETFWKFMFHPAWKKLVYIGNESSPDEHLDFTEFGTVRVDFIRHEAWRAGTPVSLTAFEFRILKFFVANPCRVISRNELLETVWGYNCYPTTRTVDNKILRLRQNLETDPAKPVHFLTVHGAGYKFVP